MISEVLFSRFVLKNFSMKQPTIETQRCIIREMLPQDIDGMFALDANPKVHTYLGNKPIKTVAEAQANVNSIRTQYIERGIGRWAVIEKSSGNFIGWTGFRVNSDYVINGKEDVFDIGYRFIESVWGKGYATETALACLEYGFKHLVYNPIYGAADIDNVASNKILQKIGMHFENTFEFDGTPHHFYSMTKQQWQAKNMV